MFENTNGTRAKCPLLLPGTTCPPPSLPRPWAPGDGRGQATPAPPLRPRLCGCAVTRTTAAAPGRRRKAGQTAWAAPSAPPRSLFSSLQPTPSLQPKTAAHLPAPTVRAALLTAHSLLPASCNRGPACSAILQGGTAATTPGLPARRIVLKL